jgi:outer membrane receptor protein involved in Fe transport
MYFNGIFDELGKELNFDITYINGNDANEEKQDYQYYDTVGVINPRLSNLLTVTDNNSYNLRIQGDYTHPFNGETRFETGYKGIFRENDNDYRYDTLNFNTNKYVTNTLLTNHFNLRENINAVYGTFSHIISDFRFKLGLRLEHTLTKGELITDSSDFKKDYLSLFPTVSLSQRIGLENELQFSYSRRITRPMIYRLNPFVDRSNSRFIYFGNPELDPEFTDSYELGHNFYSEYVTVNTSLYYRRSYDVISIYSYQVDSVTTATTYRNAAGSKTFGGDIIISSRISDWWNIYANLGLYNTSFEGSVVSDYATEEGTSWRGNIRSTFSISNLFDIEIYYNYTGRRITATGFNEPSQNLDIGIKRSFFDRKLSISLRAEDVFKTKKWQGESSGTGFTNYYTSEWDSRLFNLSISYRFGNSDKYYSKSKKTKENENEQEDVKEGN